MKFIWFIFFLILVLHCKDNRSKRLKDFEYYSHYITDNITKHLEIEEQKINNFIKKELDKIIDYEEKFSLPIVLNNTLLLKNNTNLNTNKNQYYELIDEDQEDNKKSTTLILAIFAICFGFFAAFIVIFLSILMSR